MVVKPIIQPALRTNIIKAGVWSLGAHSGELVTRLLSTLVMSRLLFPEAFAQMAASTSILIGLTLISDLGIRAVIIQSPHGEQDHFLRSAWTLQLLRGIALWAVLGCVCALISLPGVRGIFPTESIFAQPQFGLVTFVLGFTLVLSAMESTSLFVHSRRINLKPLVLLDFAGRITAVMSMIVWASMSPTVWAFVGGAIVGAVLRVALSHFWVPGTRMALQWDKKDIWEIAHFGKWITVSSTATFLSRQSDRLILGFLLAASTLGLYAIAVSLVEAVQGLLERVNALTLPVMSEVFRGDHQVAKTKYYRFRLSFDIFAGLAAGTLFVTGSLIVHVLFDKRYSDVGEMVQILALGLIAYPALIIVNIFTATGNPRAAAKASILQASSLIGNLTLGYLIAGERGVVWGVALHKIIPAIIVLAIAHKRRWVDFAKELRVIPIFFVGIAIGEAILWLSTFIDFEALRHFIRH